MGLWMRTLRVVSLFPAVLASSVVWLIVAVLLPLGVAGLMLVIAPAGLAVLWLGRSGRGGRVVDRVADVLAGAREPSEVELAALAPALTRLVDLQVDQTRLLISRGARPYPPVRSFGRDQVVISPWLVEALSQRRLDVEDAVALIAHAVGWLRAQPTRGAVAVAALTLPWRTLTSLISRVGAAARWVPLVGFAWRMRFIVGAVAAWQSAVDGRIVAAVLVALFFTATYTTPGARRAHALRLQLAADRYVVSRGLGLALLRAMHRVGTPDPEPGRGARLRAHPTGAIGADSSNELALPRLRLVPS